MSAPVGYLKTPGQSLEKDPDRRVQERILLVFQKFLELGSIRQTLMWFLDEELRFPARVDGELTWKRPRYSSIQSILTNPTYAGAYVFGRTEHGSRYEDGQARKISRRRRREEWISLIQDHHEGYIDWERFEKIQNSEDDRSKLLRRRPARSSEAGGGPIGGHPAMPAMRSEAHGQLYWRP